MLEIRLQLSLEVAIGFLRHESSQDCCNVNALHRPRRTLSHSLQRSFDGKHEEACKPPTKAPPQLNVAIPRRNLLPCSRREAQFPGRWRFSLCISKQMVRLLPQITRCSSKFKPSPHTRTLLDQNNFASSPHPCQYEIWNHCEARYHLHSVPRF